MHADAVSPPRVLGLFDWTSERPRERHELIDPAFPLPYRADLLARPGRLELEILPRAGHPVHRKVRDVVEHRSGRRVDLAVRGLLPARRADAVLAFLEPQVPVLSGLRRHGVPPYAGIPALALSCWWAQELVEGSRSPAEVRRAVDGLDRVLVLSRNQEAVFARAGVPADRVRTVRFGVDEQYYRPEDARQRAPERFDVLAAGVDRGRDWRTLVEAARRLPEVRFDVFTQPGTILQHGPPANLTVHRPVPMEEHRRNLRSARLVVVPTEDLAYPTGQSVLLEAMACGRAVAVTGTEAMRDYLLDGTANRVLPPGDPAGVAAVIGSLLADDDARERMGREGRRAVEESFTFRAMWARIRDEVLDLL